MSRAATRARLTIAAVVASVLLALGTGGPAWADSIADLTSIDETLGLAAESFIEVYSDQSASDEDAAAAASQFQTAAESAQSEFQQIADGSDNADIAGYAEEFAGDAGDMAVASGDIAAALASQDVDALSQGETDLNAAMEEYSAMVDEYNEFLETMPASLFSDPAFATWLIVLIVAVIFLALTLLFAILTRKQEGLLPPKTDKKGNVHQASLKRLRWMVVVWAGLFVVGAAIPLLQIVFAQPDATGQYTYQVFWYPLAAGAVLSVVSLVQYFVAAGKVRREGSAPQYDPVAFAGGAAPVPPGYAPMPQGYAPVPQGYAPVPTAPVAEVPAAAPVAEAAAAPVAEVPAAAPATEAPASVTEAPAPAAEAPAPYAPEAPEAVPPQR